MRLETILCDTDPYSDDQPGLERAATLAEATGARLELYLCDHLESLAGGAWFDSDKLAAAREDYMRDLRDWLAERQASLARRNLRVGYAAEWRSSRYEGILERAAAVDADLIVRAARHHSRLGRFLLAATDWELIRRAPQPLWLVKNTPSGTAKGLRVVAAVDPFHPHDEKAGLDEKLIRTASAIVEVFGGEVHVFHAFHPGATVAPVATASHHAAVPALRLGSELIREIKAQREKRLAALATGAGIPPERVHLLAGSPSSALDDVVSEQNFDVVVAGAVSRGRLERLLIGNTAESILDTVDCDMLVVKPDGFRSGE